MEYSELITNPSRYDQANLISKLFFWWNYKSFKTGLSRELTKDDIYKEPDSDDAYKTTTQLEKNWDYELREALAFNKQPNLFKAIIRTFGFSTLIFGFFLTIDEFLNLSTTFLLGVIVRFFSDNYSGVTWTQCLIHSILLILSLFLYALLRSHLFFQTSRQALRIRTALTVLVYKKILSLSRASLSKLDLGYILNVVTTDLARFDELTFSIMYIVVGPIMGLAVLIYMIYLIGLASIGLGITLLCLLPYLTITGKYANVFKSQTVLLTDKRIKLMEEMISAIKVLKMFTWESSFADMVSSVRIEEMKTIRNSSILKLFNFALGASATRIMLFSCLVTHVLLGHTLTPEIAFMVLSLCNALTLPVVDHLGYAVGILFETMVTVRRTQDVLTLDSRQTFSSKDADIDLTKGTIIFDRFSGKWDKSLEITNLNNLSFKIEPGELLVVIGSVGSGKTCLLMALLEEIDIISGSCIVSGRKSFSPQEPWTFTATIKQNILFGREYSATKYERVLKACSLEKDITLFPFGDATLVGEKGYTLSGGQKARITLARAIYEDADVYLLDDPLSAVDPGVAEHLFEKCINGYLKDKTRILITHQLQFLRRADKILIMNNGECLAFGTFDQLNNIGIDFIQFLQETTRMKSTEQQHHKIIAIDELYQNSTEPLPTQKNHNIKVVMDETSIIDDQLERRDEQITQGSLKAEVYYGYFRAGGSRFFITLLVAVTLGSQALFNYFDWWLAKWSDDSLALTQSYNGTDLASYAKPFIIDNSIVYAQLLLALLVSAFVRLAMNFWLCLKASENLHNKIFARLLKAPLQFFESNPVGRILNRFTRDIGIIDFTISTYVVYMNLDVLMVVGALVITIFVTPIVFPIIIPIFVFMWAVRRVYLSTARFMVRFEAKTRSPIYNQIAVTYEGLMTIRTFQFESRLINQFYRRLNDNNSCKFVFFGISQFIGFILGLGTVVLYSCIFAFILIFHDKFPGGEVGLVLTSLLSVFITLQYCIRLTAEFETDMVAVERILEYGRLPSEPAWTTLEPNVLPTHWPNKGAISLRNVYLRYPGTEKPTLNDLSFDVIGGEKIGIVGRTGAGKSSLITVLFRLNEFEGDIFIDGVKIKDLGLHDLRKKLSIIPQDPLLFTGTIRSNLDPLREYSDEYIWSTLNTVNLAKTIEAMPGGLDALVTQGGSNLSLGQRQLLCLIRSLLQRNKIMIFDEATASMDHQTDALIQKTIRQEFHDCTVLTVAHRLNTIIDMDKILLIDAGQVIEFGEPYILLQKENGHFRSLVNKTGSRYAEMLFSIAEKSYNEKHAKS